MTKADEKTPQTNADEVAKRELRKETLAAAEKVRARERAEAARAPKAPEEK